MTRFVFLSHPAKKEREPARIPLQTTPACGRAEHPASLSPDKKVAGCFKNAFGKKFEQMIQLHHSTRSLV